MSDNKKYYYLKLKEDFFDSSDIKLIEALPSGYEYVCLLMKLYCKSLKRDGELRVTDKIPYSFQTISSVTNHKVDVVKCAFEVFIDFGMIEIVDSGSIFMSEIQNFIGRSSTEGDRKRKYRAKINQANNILLDDGQMSHPKRDKCPKTVGHLGGQTSTRDRDRDIDRDNIERERKTQNGQMSFPSFDSNSNSKETKEDDTHKKLTLKWQNKFNEKLGKCIAPKFDNYKRTFDAMERGYTKDDIEDAINWYWNEDCKAFPIWNDKIQCRNNENFNSFIANIDNILSDLKRHNDENTMFEIKEEEEEEEIVKKVSKTKNENLPTFEVSEENIPDTFEFKNDFMKSYR